MTRRSAENTLLDLTISAPTPPMPAFAPSQANLKACCAPDPRPSALPRRVVLPPACASPLSPAKAAPPAASRVII